ncbi:MAG: response regulator transcription factor [Opitutaceae bacterium]|nr:response regulator transcription factor [Opitutaceae bacterium]
MKTSTPVIRVLLVDDSALVRRGVRSVITAHSQHGAIQVVGEAANAAEAMSEVLRLKPDVVLLDLRLPDGSGIDICRRIHTEVPETRVLVLTSFVDDNLVYNAVIAGAHGYLMKEVDPPALLEAITKAAAGQSILTPDITQRVMKMLRSGNGGKDGTSDLSSLSQQERRVLACVAEGLTNKQTGERLNLSENTVKNYLINVFEKLQVKRRSQAAALYVEQVGRPQSSALPPGP